MLGTKKPMLKPEDKTPPPDNRDPPNIGTIPVPPEPLKSDAPVQPRAPKPITLVMSKDGGLNGQCWRAGQTVTLDAEAADWFLAGGHATRAP